MYLEEVVEDNDMPAGVIVDDGNATVSESSTPSITFPTHTSPGAFNYTFLPDMSLATATTATGSTSEQARTARGGPGEASYSESGARTSGTILSVAYPTHPSSYSPEYLLHLPWTSLTQFILARAETWMALRTGAKMDTISHSPLPSAFIKSRKISSEIEGNHSMLRKIIGRVRRNLPPSELEAKLVQVADQWNEERGRTRYSSSRTPMNNERVQDVSGSSRSTSSNETERERNRAGGEWGMLNVGADHGMNQPTFPESPGSPVPLTRMFLKRSRSEPAAPRPNRPRLQLSTGDREDSEERPEYEYEHGYGGIDDWESLEIDESSVPPAGRQSFTRSHVYAVPGSNTQTLRLRIMQLPLPQVSPPGHGLALTSKETDPSTQEAHHQFLRPHQLAHPLLPPLRWNHRCLVSPQRIRISLSLRMRLSKGREGKVEVPLPDICIRLRSPLWLYKVLGFVFEQELGLHAHFLQINPGYLNTQQRSRSRGSPPPSSPASPGDTIIPPIRGRGLSSRPTHRKMPTWGGGWTYPSAGSSTEASPVPSTASVSPHRRLNASPSAGERVLTWQEVEDERRDLVRTDYDCGRRVAVVGDEVVPIADLKESVDVEELASTAGMGWQQHSTSLHSAEAQDSSPFADDEARLWLTGDETVGRSIQETQLRYLTESSPAILWTPATSGHVGFVT
ncbi:hypothetical protein D9757_013404 [Collybiopsis confluens]|uniref:Uncharacterized protein n=1 Tax=Collybiopsis confluens TaxID=2823264 RepID=A0A8H5D871_9AGAR|nr:hypothetical protein D9757_013404 [Collybiopsis confluens]